MGNVTRTRYGVSHVVTLTDEQIKALPDTPQIIVPALDGARIIQPYLVALTLAPWVADYANIDGSANITFNTPNAAYADVTLGAGAILAQSKPVLMWCDIGREFDFIPYDPSDLQGQPLQIIVDNGVLGPFEDGDTSTVLRIQTFYNVLPVAVFA